MNQNNIKAFLEQYETFKGSDPYKERIAQKAIVPVFRAIIWEVLKNEKITNQHLTDLIQIFKYNCSDENFDNKLEIKTNIKSSKDLRNVVLFGDKNEKNQKELKSIAATTLKALSSAVDPTMGALEYIARNDILSKLRGIKTAH